MGKINNKAEIEIIPVPQDSTLPKRVAYTIEDRTKMQKIPYISDPTLIPRIHKYLESHVDNTCVDVDVMADDLQHKYREYTKRKRSAFKASVKKAYSVVLRSYGLEDQATSDDDDLSEESVHEEERRQPNSMNNQLLNLYSRPPVTKIDENELIDISSDDSEDRAAYSNNKPANGPSTSDIPQSIFFSQHASNKNNFDKSHPVKHLNPSNSERGKKRKLESASLTPLKSSSKKKKSLAELQEPSISFKDIGGLNKVLEDVCKLLIHIQHPELYKKIGITSPRGFLLHGPPGCGKTLLANAISGELNIPLLKVAATELVAGISGESEERIRELFERALSYAPCVLFIDEIDAITQNRQNAQKDMERRIVAQLLSCLDDLSQNEEGDRVLVVGATNRPDSIDPALRRAGRFDREICLGIPDLESRVEILKVLTRHLKLSENFDFETLAKHTPGFVGADLLSLTREAAMSAVNRAFNDIKEARRLEEILRLQRQKMLEEEQKAKEAASAISEDQKDTSNESNKSDPEIIVDDDVSKEATPSDSVNGSIEAVVVIDDDNVKASSEVLKPTNESVNGETTENKAVSELEPMPVDSVFKPLSPLEELICWLHEKVPISDSQLQTLFITMDDFANALKCVQPSAKREGFATVPDITWDDVGSLSEIREELQMAILAPVRHAEQFKTLGINVPTGVLLCGPPGCGKTLLAKAIANEAGINFISVKGPELLNMYVGESERAVRVCFERARNSAPCVIFFDELDALCPKRSDSREGGSTMRVVNQMLTEMDGVEGRQGVYLLAASNRPDIIDPAVLRPGRLDKIIFVGLPSKTDRVDILRAITKNGTKPRLAPDVDLETIGNSEMCAGYTGADLAALVREAGILALKDFMVCGGDTQQSLEVTTEHFKKAISKIRPSVPEKDQKHYEKLRKIYTAVPEQNEVEEMEYS